MKNKIELLSPVGSFENLHAAIQGGADAIYFGVEQLNMRAKSINSFSINDTTDFIKNSFPVFFGHAPDFRQHQ
jgi:putative protease